MDFPVYQASKKLYKNLLKDTHAVNNYALRDQANRAALSVILNITEGYARNTDKEFNYHIRVALGSINEVAACIQLLTETNLLHQDVYDRYILGCESIAKQLGGLSKNLIKQYSIGG